MGREDLIAADIDSYVAKAIDLANDLPRLTGLRTDMTQQILNSPACDTAAFTHDLEMSFHRVWQTWCSATHQAD